MEQQVATRPYELAPALVVGPRTLVGVVAVDEQQLERRRRRVDRTRVAYDEVHFAVEAVALESVSQLAVQLLAGDVRRTGDVEVVRPELDAFGKRGREDERAPAL